LEVFSSTLSKGMGSGGGMHIPKGAIRRYHVAAGRKKPVDPLPGQRGMEDCVIVWGRECKWT